MNDLITDQNYRRINFKEEPITADFELCTFENCSFSEATISHLSFTECTFENCDFSGVKVIATAIQECEFISCKMLGINFENCSDFLFQLNCKDCTLDFSTFYKVDLRLSQFTSCQLNQVDFTEANLTGISLKNCELAGTIFQQTNLSNVDFSTATNYNIHPEQNKIKGAIFSNEGVKGLLQSYSIKIIDN